MNIGAKELEKRVKAFSEVSRRHGGKVTHQRSEIYRELAKTHEHPDAETIYRRVRKRIPSISLDTVYRTLRLLEDEGLISRVGSMGERTRFDANIDRHLHFVCTECGFIGDVYNEEWNNVRPPKDLTAMGKVNSVHVELRGLCKACQWKQRLPSPRRK
jgi:Fur family peroxide stress response transcriptional regulator